jgi:hypothetical protein
MKIRDYEKYNQPPMGDSKGKATSSEKPVDDASKLEALAR